MKLRPPVGLRLGALACCLAAELVTSGPALSQGAATAPTPAAATVTQTTPDGKTVKTVIADGLGSTVESAVQNAAENALKQVVGSLIDTEKQVERRSQIADGIRSETRNVTSKVREYSQGSIQSFEVLETSQDGAIVRVAAKVGVRIDDFKAYLQKVAEGEATVDRGLYPQVVAKASVNQQQEGDKAAIFVDRVLTPILRNEGVSFTVGKLEAAADDRIPNCRTLNWCRGSDLTNWYVLPITLAIDQVVIKNIEQTVKQISSDTGLATSDQIAADKMYSVSQFASEGSSYANQWPYRLSGNVIIQFPYGRSASVNLYQITLNRPHTISGAASSFSKNDENKIVELFQKYYNTRLNVDFIAADGESVAAYNISPYSPQVGKEIHLTSSWIRFAAPRGGIRLGDHALFGTLMGPAAGSGQTFQLVVKVPPAAIKDAVRVAVRLTQ